MAKAPQDPKSDREIVGIHVKFTLNTPDQLRRVVFELRKESDDDTAQWTIGFQLFERKVKTDPFPDPIVDLEVEVDEQLSDKAETMADNGMSKKQARHAIGKAADTAKDPKASMKTKKDTVEATLTK